MLNKISTAGITTRDLIRGGEPYYSAADDSDIKPITLS